MADIGREHPPDVFLLCGDVYTTQPSAAVQTLLTIKPIQASTKNNIK